VALLALYTDCMEAAEAIVLATMLALTGAMHDGLQAFERDAFADAIPHFTKVIEVNSAANVMKPLALYYRARCHHQLEQQKEALADLRDLIIADARPDITGPALSLYEAWGGERAALLPEDGPRLAWAGFLDALGAGDLAQAKARATGQFATMFTQPRRAQRQQQVLQAYHRSLSRWQVLGEEIGEGDEHGFAWIGISQNNNRMTVKLILDKHRWLVAGYDSQRPGVGGAVDSPEAIRQRIDANAAALAKVAAAVATRRQQATPGTLPTTLTALLADAAGEAAPRWRHPKTGLRAAFLYRPAAALQGAAVETVYVAASPAAYNGRRHVVFADGRIEEADEATFLAAAKKQGWQLKDAGETLPAELKAQVASLIARLSHSSFRKRREALQALTELTAARPLLERYRQHVDPEVRAAIHQILESD
jgi:hypothetical protein